MSRGLVPALLLAVVSLRSAPAEEPKKGPDARENTHARTLEQLEKDSRAILQEMTQALKSVKDAASAEAASPKLKQLVERMVKMKADFARVRQESPRKKPVKPPTEAEKRKAEKAVQDEAWAWSRVTTPWEREVRRVSTLPAAWNTLRKNAPLAKLISDWTVARVKLDTLNNAVKAYYLRNGVYPPTLPDLLQKTEQGGPYLQKEEELLDPWRQEYQYDPVGLRNNHQHADVWTVTPFGPMIGNWRD